MAGVSAAAHLAAFGRVILLERESQPGYHSTGRSAALFSETYGNLAVRLLTRAGRAYYESRADGLAEHPIMTPRGALFFAMPGQERLLEAIWAELSPQRPTMARLDPARAGKLLVSPADETPVPPCDVQPDELDVAIAVDRLVERTTIEVRQVERKWAGLHCFVADKTPVCGFDLLADGFFWLAGQGGYGIQTAEGLARSTAGLIAHNRLPDDLAELGLDTATLSPARFRGPG